MLLFFEVGLVESSVMEVRLEGSPGKVWERGCCFCVRYLVEGIGFGC